MRSAAKASCAPFVDDKQPEYAAICALVTLVFVNPRIFAFALLVITAGCATPRALTQPCAAPAADSDWSTLTPADAGFDAHALCDRLTEVSTSSLNVHAVLVERHGHLVAELYRAGTDHPFSAAYGLLPTGDTQRDAGALHDVRSVTKSVTSLLVGTARAPLPTARLRGVALDDLLSMSTGREWHEWGEGPLSSSETGLIWQQDLFHYVLDRPQVAAPGTHFNYDGGNTAVVAALLAQGERSGDVEALARARLFAPLHIEAWEWIKDLHGRPLANAGLRLRPRDMLKLGRLVLDKGSWHGARVVPEEWIIDSTTPRVNTGTDLFSLTGEPVFYGKQWWTARFPFRGRTLTWVQAIGNGGQRIFMVPELDVTVVLLAGDYGSRDMQRAENGILLSILEALAPANGAQSIGARSPESFHGSPGFSS